MPPLIRGRTRGSHLVGHVRRWATLSDSPNQSQPANRGEHRLRMGHRGPPFLSGFQQPKLSPGALSLSTTSMGSTSSALVIPTVVLLAVSFKSCRECAGGPSAQHSTSHSPCPHLIATAVVVPMPFMVPIVAILNVEGLCARVRRVIGRGSRSSSACVPRGRVAPARRALGYKGLNTMIGICYVFARRRSNMTVALLFLFEMPRAEEGVAGPGAG